MYAYVQASAGSHNSNAQSTTWENTQLAGKNVVLTSKGDTALRGAVVTADRIDAAALQLVSHAVLGAVLAEVNGAPMTGGALAGAGGELAAKYLTQTLPWLRRIGSMRPHCSWYLMRYLARYLPR
nr:hemagglutinin repeat-containing protein [Xanthomonas dyei]